MKKKFKMGPLQKMWVSQLRKHPERQGIEQLGAGSPEKYTACCLGELHLCAFRLKKQKLPFFNGEIVDKNINEKDDSCILLENSYEKYGLRNEYGELLRGFNNYFTLAEANDSGCSWLELADFIEQNPEAVFTKSV